MKRIIFGGLFLATLSLASASPALAAASYDGSGIAQKIKLQGYMPLTRVIYIDQQDRILSVVGNTNKNITPSVAHPNSPQQLNMTSYIKQQYQDLLDANGGNLKAGVTYYPASADLLKMSIAKPVNG